ncbi:MAG: biotin synthase BioB [Verrucomicrobiae bacterium]|nr:biotin synthase BioB [Verrucomicrobiae bacterium]
MSRLSLDELRRLHHQPFFHLLRQAREAYERHWEGEGVQLCSLLSIKTGGCSEDCGYCAQSARHAAGVTPTPLMDEEEILAVARRAKELGAQRFCMGAAWKGVREDDPRFERVVSAVREVGKLGMETCVTLGHLTDGAARALKEAGLTAYNHNVDTSPEHYGKIVTTHTFQDRLDTILRVQEAGISLCCGGILGMGESAEDRLRMLEVLVGMTPPPESVPINCLTPIPGTPLEGRPPVDVLDLVRMIATARIALPKSRVRLSAGRAALSREAQALCFFAGANSIFYGEKLLTTKNPGVNEDLELLAALDLAPQAAERR